MPVNDQPAPLACSTKPRGKLREIVSRRVVTPLLDILRVGATPRRLAWSLAVGLIIGINPLLGSTTLVALLAACIFRLNLVASQIANHIVYPLQLVLFFAFIRMGDKLFHTGRLPMRRKEIFESVRHHPWDTTRALWSWEWHALIVWLLLAAILTPILVFALTPMLEGLAASITHKPDQSKAERL